MGTIQIAIPEIWTLVLAVLAIGFGRTLHRLLPRLQAWNIPAAITGGLVIAVGITLLRALSGVEIVPSGGIRQMLLLVFFIGIGLSDKFGALLRGGVGVAVICLAIVTAIVAQNLVGAFVARTFGLDAPLGMFLGSIPFLGGHGTAAAWAHAPQAEGIQGALEVGMAAATLGLIAGGVVGGPVATWLARRHVATAEPPAVAGMTGIPEEHHLSTADLLDSDRWLIVVLVIGICLGLGELLRTWSAGHGWVVPGFLAVMAVAIVITNVADAADKPVDLAVTDLTGTVALRLFLAISMIGLKLWELVDLVIPLLLAVLMQAVAVVAVALAIVYPLLGGGRQGAIACGGFIGLALGAMPVGLGVMKRLAATFGPAPRAFLCITLAAALFGDTANAVLIGLGFSLLK